MDRKTNLFYNSSSQDSNFITFSNYTESLTGNFLSTDTKLFPSTFMCLKIPKLNVSAEEYDNVKQKFIDDYLIRRYENKMAFLRDYCKHYANNITNPNYVVNSDLAESELMPLNYLLEYIYEYDPDTEISFIDNITEQDYNGTFTDTICVINANKFKTAYAYFDNTIPQNAAMYDATQAYLYGWSTKATEQYCLQYDFDRNGHVDDVDLNFFKEDEEHIKEVIIAEHNNKISASDVAAIYEKKLSEIEEMVENNKTLPTLYTGPDYSYIYSYSYALVTEEDCCGKPTCQCPPAEEYEDMYEEFTDANNTTYITSVSDNSYMFTYTIENSYLSPLFDIPAIPTREEFTTDELFNDAMSEYEEKPKYYKVTSNISYIGVTTEYEVCAAESSIKNVEFNVIIPMYDVIDMNALTNSFKIDEVDRIDLQNDIASPSMYIKNVPMGIWFSGSDPVVLKRDQSSKMSPSWSLVIGSQFKPFPYSKQMPDEIESSAKVDAYMTFSQILTKQNDIIDKMNELFLMMSSVNGRITELESKVASQGTLANIDDLHQDMITLETKVNNEIAEIKNTLEDYSLIWVNREG